MNFQDPAKGFMPYPSVPVAHAESGPLFGLTFGVKDVFDVAGYPTSAGQPLWLAQSGVKSKTAPSVAELAHAGAHFTGKTITDELAFSIIGDNAHFGAPLNAAAPTRYTGGSSSGSAAAVAHGLVDFALGTDTGGSVRVPASNCGIFGLRPSHGRVSLEGAHALAPSFDTCGWFARDLGTLARVSEVLLGAQCDRLVAQAQLIKPTDLWDCASPDVSLALAPVENYLVKLFGELTACRAALESPAKMFECFRTIQGYEAWEIHGPRIQQYRPVLGPGIKERFEWASQVSAAQHEQARVFQHKVSQSLGELLGSSRFLVLPTVPDVAPLKGSSATDLDDYRKNAFCMLCVAGLAGLPQLSMPLASCRGAPIGLSLIGPRGSDEMLISIAKTVLSEFPMSASGAGQGKHP